MKTRKIFQSKKGHEGKRGQSAMTIEAAKKVISDIMVWESVNEFIPYKRPHSRSKVDKAWVVLFVDALTKAFVEEKRFPQNAGETRSRFTIKV